MFTGIPHTEIDSVWPEIVPLIEIGCASLKGRAIPNDIRESLKSQDLQLWINRGDGIDLCVVTQIINYPKKRYCRLCIVTGSNRFGWQDNLQVIEAWALAQGCHGMESIARAGWWRAFIRFLKGWEKTHIFIEKEF